MAFKELEEQIRSLQLRLAEVAKDRPLRLKFATKVALDAFDGWPGLVGFVESTETEYLWRDDWILWSKPWTPYTPTWTNLTVGNGASVGRWSVASGVLHMWIDFIFGTTTTVSGNFHPSAPLPVGASNVGTAWAFDASPFTWETGVLVPNSYLVYGRARANRTNPWTWAAGDVVRISLTAEL